jgi:hypothetical protein
MTCYQSTDLPSGVTTTGRTSYATEADCLQSCKEGACCEGTTCSVKPQCQCQGTGKTFKGVGTTCISGTCSPCGCESPKLQTLTITTGSPQNTSGFYQTDGSVFSQIVDVLGNKTFMLSFFRSSAAAFEHTNNQSLLYLRSSSNDANFLGQQSEIDAMQTGEVIWRSLATCPASGSQGLCISDVWAKVSVSGAQYIIKWGTRDLFFNSCSGGSQTSTPLGSSFVSSGGGTNAKLFLLQATVSLA